MFRGKGYSDGVIIEWLLQLDKTLSEAKKKYGEIDTSETSVIYSEIKDIEDIDNEIKQTRLEKTRKILKLKEKLNNPNYIPPWKRD
jgi:hypothetical protein